MLQRARPAQDENDTLLQGKPLANAENPQTARKRAPLGSNLAPGSTRKVMGNITNQALGKQQGSAAPRRALGDITNATPAAKVRAAHQLFRDLENIPTADKALNSEKRVLQKEDLWAEDGIEHLAGKGFSELQRDRDKAMKKEIRAKVKNVLSLSRGFLPYEEYGESRDPRRLQRPQLRPASPVHYAPAKDVDLDLTDLCLGEPSPRPPLETID